jgi:hypothetical protein
MAVNDCPDLEKVSDVPQKLLLLSLTGLETGPVGCLWGGKAVFPGK